VRLTGSVLLSDLIERLALKPCLSGGDRFSLSIN
jgi:hypothetical protein